MSEQNDVAGSYRASERDRGVRLDVFLKERIPKLSRCRIQEAILDRVVVPGRERVRPSLPLRTGDLVVVLRPPEQQGPFGFEPEILYEDDDLVAVSKPAGVPVHATRQAVSHHVIGWLRAHRGVAVALAHRLDRETSGLLLSTRNTAAARGLARDFAAGRIRKEYLAIVFGHPPERLTIDAPIGPDPSSAVYVKQAVVSLGGQRSITEVERLRKLGPWALVSARPRTGRRHQIRVHLASEGFPVVGDKLYAAGERHFLNFIARGLSESMLGELGAERQLLHAARLSFRHPRTGEPIDIEAPLPLDMASVSRQFERNDGHGA